MAFVPETDANWAAYQKTRAAMNAEEANMFDQMMIHNMCLQHTTGATVSSASFTTSLATVKESVKSRKRTF